MDYFSKTATEYSEQRLRKLKAALGLLGVNEEEAAIKVATKSEKRRDRYGRRLDKPHGNGVEREKPERDAQGYRINKPFDPRRTQRR